MDRHHRRSLAFLAAFLFAVGIAQPASAQLGARTAEQWIATLESTNRVAGLKLSETVSALRLKPGMIVADIGAGTGVFTVPLAQAVRPDGKVYAVEVEKDLLAHIDKRVTEQGLTNVETIPGEFTDPALPSADVDLAFINDVLHHIEDRAAYLKALAKYLNPAGRIAVIDFRPGQGGHLNQPEMRVTQEQVAAWMAAAGFKPVEEINLFTDKWFVIYARQ